jgi:hypothetical protein
MMCNVVKVMKRTVIVTRKAISRVASHSTMSRRVINASSTRGWFPIEFHVESLSTAIVLK